MAGVFSDGDVAVHARLCVASCVLAELLRLAPDPVSVAALAAAAGHPAREVERTCDRLWKSGLLRPDPARLDGWMLARPPEAVTLADLFAALFSGPPSAMPDS